MTRTRFRPSEAARREIRPWVRRVNVINRQPFERLVREIVDEMSSGPMRVESAAVGVLLEAATGLIDGLHESAAIGAAFGQRSCIGAGDMALARRIRGM